MAKTVYVLLLILLFLSPGVVFPAESQEAASVKAQGLLRKAFEAARAIKKRAVRRQLLEEIGRDQVCAGDLAGAHRVVEASEDAKGAAMILAAIAEAQATGGDGNAARATLAEAMKRAEHVAQQDCREPLGWIVHAYLAAGDLSGAARAASRYPSEFDRILAKIKIANAHLAAGHPKEAKTLAEEVAEAYSRSEDIFFTWRIREEIWPLYLQLGEVAEALRFARGIPAKSFDRCRALCAIGEHQAKGGDPEAASLTFAEAFEAAGEIEGEAAARESQMTRVVFSQVRVGHLSLALKTVRRMPDGYYKVDAFQGVAAAQAKAGDARGARTTLDQAIAIAQRLHYASSKAEALTLLAQCQAEIGDKTAARDTAVKAFQAACQVDYEGGLRAACFAEIAKLQAQIGDRAAAQETLHEALRRARAVRDAEYRSEEVCEIAKAQSAAGFAKEAQATLRELLLPLIPFSWPGPDGREDAAGLLARAGDYVGAYRMAKEVQEGVSFRAVAVRKVAAYHAMAKGPDEPLALADKEGDPVLRSSMYHGIALGLLKARGIEAPSFWLIVPED